MENKRLHSKKIHVYMLHRLNLSWDKLGINPSPFHISTRLRLTLAVVARGVHVAACSTAFRSTTEEINSGGHVDGT